ncbi:MAG TPA: AAA family ATPase [Bradyrhizobium sp.]
MTPTGIIVAIASGKGGVGKTWLAITLSHALARAGQRVLLFDGDLGLANVDVQLGLNPGRDIGGMLAGQRTLGESVVRHLGEFDILAGHSGSGALSAVDPEALELLLSELRGLAFSYDVVLLDVGAGLDRSVRRMVNYADGLLVVATEEPTSLTDAYAVLKIYSGDGGAADRNAAIVVNMASSRSAGERTYQSLARACRTFLGRTPTCVGVIRRDDHVRDAIRRQTLLLSRHPTCAASADVESISGEMRRFLVGLG